MDILPALSCPYLTKRVIVNPALLSIYGINPDTDILIGIFIFELLPDLGSDYWTLTNL